MRAVGVATILLSLIIAGCVSPGSSVSTSSTDPLALPQLPAFGGIVKVGEFGNEPVIRVGPEGTIYVAALQHLYISKDHGATFKEAEFRAPVAVPIYASDSALAVAPDGRVYISFDWPYAGSTSVCTSGDQGSTWSCDFAAVPGVTDRMWMVAPTAKDAYVITGEQLDRPTFAVTHDAGATWTITANDWTNEVQGEDLNWDPVLEVIVEAASDPNGPGWGIRTFTPDGAYKGFQPIDLSVPAGQPNLAVDANGTWWAGACTAKDCASPALAESHDAGKSWALHPLAMFGRTMIMPYVAAGAAGHVAMGWYEANASSADAPEAEWHFVVARTADGSHFESTLLTAMPVHVGPLCRAVTCLGDNRFAGDFVGLAFDAKGDLHATWMRQDKPKDLPTSQLNPSGSYEHVEYARTS